MPSYVACPKCGRNISVPFGLDSPEQCPHCGADFSEPDVKTYSLEGQIKPARDKKSDKKRSRREDESDSDESPRGKRKIASRPRKYSRDEDDDHYEHDDYDDDFDDEPRRRGVKRRSNKSQGGPFGWIKSQNLEVLIPSIGFSIYLIFLLLSFLSRPFALVAVSIAGLGVVAYVIMYHAIILHGDGAGTLLMVLFIPFYGWIYLFNNFDELWKPLLLLFLCALGVFVASRRMPSTNQWNAARQNDPGVHDRGGVQDNPGGIPPKGAGQGIPDPESKVNENPRINEKGIFYLSDLGEFDFVPGPPALGWKFGKHGTLGDFIHTPIMANGILYTKGLGMHPPVPGKFTQISYRPGEKLQKLKGSVSINDTSKRAGSPMRFEVLGDRESLWKSKPIQIKGDLEGFEVDVRQVKLLQLRVTADGSNINGCYAVWLDPYIVVE